MGLSDFLRSLQPEQDELEEHRQFHEMTFLDPYVPRFSHPLPSEGDERWITAVLMNDRLFLFDWKYRYSRGIISADQIAPSRMQHDQYRLLLQLDNPIPRRYQ